MRRTRLVWFVAGLLVATVINLAVKLLSAAPSEAKSQYLVVADRHEDREKVDFQSRQINEANPKILRGCGIKSFVIWQADGIPDGQGVTSGFKPSEQSDDSVTCVLSALADGKVFGRLESAAHPNDLAPEIIQTKKQEAALKNAQTH